MISLEFSEFFLYLFICVSLFFADIFKNKLEDFF